MKTTPKSLRLQIGLFGRTNVGKSSFLNMVSGQDVAITSEIPGTTTDVVEKTMELLPVGPVVFLDTAGTDDVSMLADKRMEKTRKIFDRADVIVLLTEAGVFGDFEREILNQAKTRQTPVIAVINKIDLQEPEENFIKTLSEQSPHVLCCSSVSPEKRDAYVNAFKEHIATVCPEDFLRTPSLIGDLIPAGGLIVLIVPIDLEAPKGRLILPQVQTIRDALDNDAGVLVVKEREYRAYLDKLKNPPDLVVCDSQVVQKMVADTPDHIKCTTFSILFARFKGDLVRLAEGAAAIDRLKPDDKILIAESCSHHAIEDDIGRVKIPRWLRQYAGVNLNIDTFAGRDYPENLKEYKLIVHCGSCMLTRREMLFRLYYAKKAGVPVTNYGVAISLVQGVLKRALEPFPAALEAYTRAVQAKT